MSNEEKVDLASSAWEEYGLSPTLAVLGLPKSTWYYADEFFLASIIYPSNEEKATDVNVD